MRRSGIYRIELGNGYFYIGSAVDLASRESRHRRELKRGVHCNRRMQRCWNKHGLSEFAVLELCHEEECVVREQKYLDQHFDHPKNVNICSTAGSTLGVVPSVETKEKMSAAKKGKTLSVEHCANISTAQRNRSAKHRANMSAAQKGRTFSDEHRANLSAARKGIILSTEHRANIGAAAKKRSAKFRMDQLVMEEMERGQKAC